MKIIISMLLVLGLNLIQSTRALAWGERGHNTVGYVAALATKTALTEDEKLKVGGFFAERTFEFGHLNNIPDISWKDSRNTDARKLNPPTHYLDTEMYLSLPTNGYDDAYLNRLRAIEKDYKKLLAQFDQKANPLPGAKSKNLNVFFDAGTAPWRTQELFDLMVQALTCAKTKPKVNNAFAQRKYFKDPFTLVNGKATFICKPKSTRLENIYAAVVLGGILGHFVADLSQPYHCTADFDGWATGQGGIHSYFETMVLHGFDEDFKFHVTTGATKPTDNEKIWSKLGGDPKDKYFAVQTMLNLAADSLRLYPTLQKMDRELAVTELGEKLPWGSSPGKKSAQRKSPIDDKIVKAFQPIITERITTASIVLSRLWVEAWRQAGSPNLADVNLIAIPYPLDVPFLVPGYFKKVDR